MKKLFTLLLAVLMLALPVFSGAETVDVSAESLLGITTDFCAKYQAQGQERITTVSFVPGEYLLAMVGEEYSAAVSDLLSALSVQTKVQENENQVQGGFSLLLNGEDAVSLLVAACQEGLFATSNLTGEDIYMLTPDDLKELAKQFSQNLVAQGSITQEQLDEIKAQLAEFSKDPVAAVSAMVGEVDLTGVQNALTPILASLSMEAVTEAPEKMPDATTVITVPLKKADLSLLMEEIAKLIWNMPITQKLAPSVTTSSGQPLTEESLTAGLKKFPDALAEDTALLIYTNEAGDKVYTTSAMKLNANGEVADLDFGLLLDVPETGVNLSWELNAARKDQKVFAAGDLKATDNHLDYVITVDTAEGEGETWRPLEEIIDVDYTSQEDSFALGAKVTQRIRSDAAAEPVGIVFTVNGVSQDKGDHAEDKATVILSLENAGELLTVNVDEVTGLAEAWITNPEIAVRPMAMSQEELSALGEKVLNSLQLGLITTMQKLPSSVLQLVGGLMGGQ